MAEKETGCWRRDGEKRREEGCGGISRRGEGLGAKRKVSVDQTLILNPLCTAANLPHCACHTQSVVFVCVWANSPLWKFWSPLLWLNRSGQLLQRTHMNTHRQRAFLKVPPTPYPDPPPLRLLVFVEGPPH